MSEHCSACLSTSLNAAGASEMLIKGMVVHVSSATCFSLRKVNQRERIGGLKDHTEIHITARVRFIAGQGAKQSQFLDAIEPWPFQLVLAEQVNDLPLIPGQPCIDWGHGVLPSCFSKYPQTPR